MNRSIGISLGWKCRSAEFAVQNRYRERKANGYNTCPFDLMISNYDGLVQCILDDFKYFCDTEYLELRKMGEDTLWKGDTFIYNKLYKFIFNHESPGHANLYINENWPNGINHYINNNYDQFCIRYNKRINNFRNYINNSILSGSKIIFILERFNSSDNSIAALYNAIHTRYPNLKYEIKCIETSGADPYIHLTILMGVDENSDEVVRLKK